MAWSDASGVSLRYELAGTGPASLVLLHELGGSLESWDAAVPLLASQCRLLRYDHRGAGLSEKVRAPYAMADHVADLAALLEAAGLTPPLYLAGAAMGAAIAVAYAARHPDRVAGLILCAPALGVDADRRQYLIDRSLRAAHGGMRAVADDTLDRSYPPVVRRDPATYDTYRARFLANDPVSYGLANRAFADSTVAADAPSVTCPCLLLAGEYDGLRPAAQVRALAASIPHAGFELLDSGHLMSVQAPAALAARILRFISEQ